MNMPTLLKEWLDLNDGYVSTYNDGHTFNLNFDDGSSKSISTGETEEVMSQEVTPLVVQALVNKGIEFHIAFKPNRGVVIQVGNLNYSGNLIGYGLLLPYLTLSKVNLYQEKYSHAQILAELQNGDFTDSKLVWLALAFSEMPANTANNTNPKIVSMVTFDDMGVFARCDSSLREVKEVLNSMRRNEYLWNRTHIHTDIGKPYTNFSFDI